MKEAAQFAGFIAVQAFLEVAAGKSPTPLVSFENADGTARFIQVQEKSPEKAAFKGEALLKANDGNAECGVLAFDAYLNLPEGQSEAIFLHARQFKPKVEKLLFAIPYLRARGDSPLVIKRVKVIAIEEEGIPTTELFASFFNGIEKHPKVATWKAHYNDKA